MTTQLVWDADVEIMTQYDEELVGDPVNGFVSDATHKFWRDRGALLVTTSVFARQMHQWVPVMVTYSNGATAQHYEHHFLALMYAIADRAQQINYKLRYSNLAGVGRSQLCEISV